jgi:hypothetical protein
MSSSHWEDVTSIFQSAAAELTASKQQAQPMVHSSDFSLFESMSAAELMDPKMDQCFEYVKVLHALRSSTLYELPLPDLSLASNEQVTLLFDEVFAALLHLFVNQVAVFNGVSIMESTHNCVLVWKVCCSLSLSLSLSLYLSLSLSLSLSKCGSRAM